MPSVIQQLKAHGSSLFDGRGSLLSLWQEIADNFYPERADFTLQRNLGAEFAANLITSYPMIIRRDLGNAFGAMLRPSAKDWFKTVSKRQDKIDSDGKQWLAWFTKLQKRAMYDKIAMFQRATSTADQDFAAFGQTVIQCRWIRPKLGHPHLHHQCWHLRDVAWQENALGKIDTVFRKWTPAAIDIVRHFPDTVHPGIKQKAKDKPFDTHEIWHCVVPLDLYESLDGAEQIRQPWVNIFFDPQHETVLEAVGSWVFEYVIPRWARVTTWQYAFSPPTIAGLPDGRLIQAMTQVIYDSGEKAVSPPLIGVREAIRSDIDVRANGFTAVDPDYDERMGEVLRPLTRDIKGFNIGPELVKDIREQLKDAFFLNKLNLPPTGAGGRDMTAYEVGQRVQEYIRNALPLFEPVETDYNGELCETDMQLILHNDPTIRRTIPQSLGSGGPDDFAFIFESPLRDAVDKAKVGQFTEAQQIISAALPLDKSAGYLIDLPKATRDVLDAVVPADWIRGEDAVSQMSSAAQAAQKQQQMLDLMAKGAGVAKDGAAAMSDAAGAMATQGPT